TQTNPADNHVGRAASFLLVRSFWFGSEHKISCPVGTLPGSEVLDHPSVAIYGVAFDREVPPIGRRDTPRLHTTLRLPRDGRVTFQVDVKQRRPPGRLTANVEPLAVRQPTHRLETIPSVHDQLARRATCKRQATDAVFSAWEQHGDLGTVGRQVPPVLGTGACRNPDNLTTSALYRIECRKDQ